MLFIIWRWSFNERFLHPDVFTLQVGPAYFHMVYFFHEPRSTWQFLKLLLSSSSFSPGISPGKESYWRYWSSCPTKISSIMTESHLGRNLIPLPSLSLYSSPFSDLPPLGAALPVAWWQLPGAPEPALPCQMCKVYYRMYIGCIGDLHSLKEEVDGLRWVILHKPSRYQLSTDNSPHHLHKR